MDHLLSFLTEGEELHPYRLLHALAHALYRDLAWQSTERAKEQ
jgi:hypothetical protein